MIKIIILCLFIVVIFSYDSSTTTDFSGHWNFENSNTTFDLTISQNKTVLSGTHCSVLYEGEKIDCSIDDSDTTIIGTASDADSAIVKFKTTVSGKIGLATIKRINANQIIWNITKQPKGEYFIPKNATLNKQ